MAKLEKVERAPVIEPPILSVTLTLTPEEAETLRTVCWVTGGVRGTRRDHMDAINTALMEAGFTKPPKANDIQGNSKIYFEYRTT